MTNFINLNKIQKIVLTIGFLIFSGSCYHLYDYYTNVISNSNHIFSRGHFHMVMYNCVHMLFYTFIVMFILDKKMNIFNKVQKIGLLVGGYFISSHLVGIIHKILFFLLDISTIKFPLYEDYKLMGLSGDGLFENNIIVIILSIIFTRIWIFLFKNRISI